MKNKYGEEMDRNGYAPSIVGESDKCYICGRTDRRIHRHEVYHGGNRTMSKNLGLWVNICEHCHDQLHHHDASLDERLKREVQILAMEYYGWEADDFRREIGKNYV